jgi:hypothetical protein
MNKSRNRDGTFSRRLSGEMFEGFAVYSDSKGYKCIWIDGRDVKIHVFVWERVNGEKPKGHDIHHMDENKANYSLDNLQLLSHSDHQKIHAGWIKTSGEWSHKPCTQCGDVLPIGDFYPRKGYTPSAKCKPCHCEQTKKWQSNNPEKTKKIKLKSYLKHKRQGGKTNVGE